MFGYDFIMADPAWTFVTYSEKGHEKAPQAHYDCQSLDEIKALPVGQLASRDCVLWLWACNPMLDQAFDVIKAWGFQFKTAGSWAKKTVNGKYRWGPGYVLRTTNEPYLIATTGNPQIKAIQSGFDGLAREHSRKPDEAYELAERMCPNARRLNMFTRETRVGWDSTGDEATKFDEVAA